MLTPMSSWRSLLVGIVVVTACLSGCPKPEPAGPDAGAADADTPAGMDAASPEIDAGRDAGGSVLAFTARAVSDGKTTALVADPAAEDVASDSRFEVDLGELRDVRVRLLDSEDRAVPSTDRLELGKPTRYSLTPTDPLPPGSRFTIVVDGLKGWAPTTPNGSALPTAQIAFRTAGERPTPAGKPAKAKKKPKKR